mgnify:CR=1 FL=1
MCDENTICIVPIQGVTWTGLNDDVEALDKALDAYNAKTGYDIPIHVDAASGGFILPFLSPETKWDFRLKWVLSISTSGHKFGLVYPGLGWVVWKDKKYLPEEMAFSVNYLGANITQVGLNFSRPAAQILGQYYQLSVSDSRLQTKSNITVWKSRNTSTKKSVRWPHSLITATRL